MKYSFMLFIYILATNLYVESQHFQIFHGQGGHTGILIEDQVYGQHTSIVEDQGMPITLEVINAHPLLYQYEFTTEDVDIETEKPDISALLNLLNTSLGNIGNEAKTEVLTIEDNKRNQDGSLRLSKFSAQDRIDLSRYGNWKEAYAMEIEGFKLAIEAAVNIIKQSDFPGSISDAINRSQSHGLLYAKNELNSNIIFTESDLRLYIQSIQQKYKVSGNPYFYNAANKQQVLSMDIFDNYLNSLLTKAIDLKKAFDNHQKSIATFGLTLGNTKKIIYLNIKSKNESITHRDTGEKIVKIEIVPNYQRPVLELIPIAFFYQSKGRKKFGIEDGIITEREEEAFDFGVGLSLNLNFLDWGKRKEYALSAGLGFAEAGRTFDNFFGNLSVSYLKWARLGVGYGYLRTPTSLKNGLKAGDLATDMNDLSSSIQYRRKPTFFITIVLPGLNLPMIK